MKLENANPVRAVRHNNRRPRSPSSEHGRVISPLEVFIERAWQGARRCRQCAAVHGNYPCSPSSAVRNEWRYSGDGLQLFVHLLTCQPSGRPRLQVMVLLENGGQSHARAIYSCELPIATYQEGPWTARLVTETSKCDFVFPGEVEVAASNELSTPRQ
jgi:hypothetical protein